MVNNCSNGIISSMKMINKRIITIILTSVLVLMLSMLSGCGIQDTGKVPTDSAGPAPIEPSDK